MVRLSENELMPFGKYEDMAIKEILEKDPRYILWVQDTNKVYKFEKPIIEKALRNVNKH